ncbi:hypothetical protein AMECASPLE_035908, partial [Ameca splendens]
VRAREDDDAACRGSICNNSRGDGHPFALLYSQDRGRAPCCLLQRRRVADLSQWSRISHYAAFHYHIQISA